jgi:hypothetical protein
MRSFLPAPRTVDEALASTLNISGLVTMTAVNSTPWFCSSTTALRAVGDGSCRLDGLPGNQ